MTTKISSIPNIPVSYFFNLTVVALNALVCFLLPKWWIMYHFCGTHCRIRKQFIKSAATSCFYTKSFLHFSVSWESMMNEEEWASPMMTSYHGLPPGLELGIPRVIRSSNMEELERVPLRCHLWVIWRQSAHLAE